MSTPIPEPDWRTKPTDRFILKWIKLHLSAPTTTTLRNLRRLRPWMITLTSAALGMAAGYWDSEGGRGPSTSATRSGRGRYQVESEISCPALVRRIDTFESGESVWQA